MFVEFIQKPDVPRNLNMLLILLNKGNQISQAPNKEQ